MSRKLLVALLGVLLVAALAGAGTFAYFSDTETSNDNTFTAGTLDLTQTLNATGPSEKVKVYKDSTEVTPPVSGNGENLKAVFGGTAGLAPGDSGTITWTLQNAGSMTGYLDVVSAVTFTTGTTPEPEPETAVTGNDTTNGDLDSYMQAKLSYSTDNGANWNYLLGNETTWGTMGELEAKLDAETDKEMASNATRIYKLEWQIPQDISGVDDNIIQGDTAEVDIEFELAQTTGQ
jgi:predicted ribosomally synthesized peptide with SipW-like signal peptide